MTAKIGSLNVDITLETARFQTDLRQAQGSVKAAQEQISRLAQRWNLSTEQIARSGTRVAASTGSMRAGMQQLNFQLNDIATQFASGTRPMQIFAQQAGQVTQAVTLLSGTTGRFGAFLAGPWGAALTAGTVLLSAIIPKLFSTSDAMNDVEFASGAMSDAQTILSRVMDLATGRITAQNKALVALARAQLLVAKIQAQARASVAANTINQSGEKQFRFGGGLGGGFSISRERGIEGQTASQFRAGVINSDQAVKRLERLRRDGRISDERFTELASAYANLGVERANSRVYDQALKALDGGGLGSLAKPGRSSRPRSGREPRDKSNAETAAAQAAELARLGEEELRARMALATDAQDRADLSLELLRTEREQRIAEVDGNKDFSDKQKAAQKAIIDRLYGEAARVDADGLTVDGKQGLLALKVLRELREDEVRLANDGLSRQADSLSALADIEPNLRERARLEDMALRLQQQIQSNLLEQEIAGGKIANAEAARAALAIEQGAAQRRLAQRNATPGQRYLDDISGTATNMNDAIEGIKVNGLRTLNDQLTDAIVNFRSLGSVVTNVAKQIIGELIHLQIQQTLIAPLAKALGLGVETDSGTKLVAAGATLATASGTLAGAAAAWTATSAQIQAAAAALAASNAGGTAPAAAGGGSLLGLFNKAVNLASKVGKIPKFANGTNFAPGGLSLVGELGPDLVDLPRGSRVYPHGRGPGNGLTVEVIANNNGFGAIVRNYAGQVIAEAAPALIDGASRVAQAQMAQRATRRLV